jgi:hypothetical protein
MSKPAKAKKSVQRDPGIGFDFGTSFLVSSEQRGKEVVSKSLRDCYTILKKSDISKNLLSDLNDVLFVETDDTLIVLADKAWKFSGAGQGNVLKTPLHRGFINPDDQDAYDILLQMAKSMVGKPVVDREILYYSIPAAPLDEEEQDEVYHRDLLESLFSELGYLLRNVKKRVFLVCVPLGDTE